MQYVYNPALDDAGKSGWDHDMAALAAFGYEPASDEPCSSLSGEETYDLVPMRFPLRVGHIVRPDFPNGDTSIGADAMIEEYVAHRVANLLGAR